MEPEFFVKLSEIPDLASKLEDPEFNSRLRTDPASVFAEYKIDIPPELIPETVELPDAERIAEIRALLMAQLAVLEGVDRSEFPWFPWIFRPEIAEMPWFPFPWFPWFGDSAS